MFDADDIAAMLDAFGDVATTDVGVISVSFFAPGQTISMFEAEILVTQPTALVATSDIATHSLVGDPGGSAITINGTGYKIRNITPEGDGFSLLELKNA